MQERAGPSNSLYALVLLLPVLGAAFFAYTLWTGITSTQGSLIQVVVPGSASLGLDAAGTYTIFYEFQSVVDGRAFSTSRNLSAMQIQVISEQTGEQVLVRDLPGSTHYTFGGRSGYSIAEFTIAQPGAYQFVAQYDGAQDGPRVVLAVGHFGAIDILVAVAEAIGILLGSFLLAALATILIYRAQRRAWTERLAAGWPATTVEQTNDSRSGEPRPGMSAVEAESRSWMLRCKVCGYERSVWDAGGIRRRARGRPLRLMRCPNCGYLTWHTTYRKPDAT